MYGFVSNILARSNRQRKCEENDAQALKRRASEISKADNAPPRSNKAGRPRTVRVELKKSTCAQCRQPIFKTGCDRVRVAGGHYLEWEVFFARETRQDSKASVSRFLPTSVARNTCYMRRYNHATRHAARRVWYCCRTLLVYALLF